MAAQKIMRGARLTSAFVASLVLTGCLNFVEYKAPEADLPDRYALLAPVPVSALETSQWWQLFDDKLLNDLVSRVLVENLNVKEAEERVAEAQGVARREGNTVSGNANLDANARNTIDTAGAGFSLNLDPFGSERSEADDATWFKRLNTFPRLPSPNTTVGLTIVRLRFCGASPCHTRNISSPSALDFP